MSGRWLLLRRAGALWAVPSRVVGSLRREGAGVAVEWVGSTWLQADELLEMATDLRSHAVPSCLGYLGLPQLHGVAVWEGAPVLLVDAAAEPPAALLPTTNDGRDPGARAAGPGGC